jgi:hypothetical protein
MTLQKRFVVVFVSSSEGVYQRAAVYDSHNLNAAFFNKNKRINSGGTAFTLAEDVVSKIQALKENYKAVIYQYDTWDEIPESSIQDVPATPTLTPPTDDLN